MSRKVRQWINSLLLGMIGAMMPFFLMTSFAATGRIAFSDPSANVGEEVSVTMKFTCTSGQALGNTDVMLAYDANMLEFINETENASGGAGAIRVWSGLDGKSEVSTTLRFKALQAGDTSITVTSWEGYDNDGQTLTVDKEGSSSIKIAGLPTSSNDATLQSLQISPGALSPAFTPATESYTASVDLNTDKLTVSAKANNDKATVTQEGGTDLKEGENTVVCKVTAEDGTTVKSYTITVSKVEGGGETAPAGTDGETTAAEPEVLAELDVAAKKVRIIALPTDVTVPDGFKESSIAIGDAKVQGWTWAEDETPRYCVFYGMNESGEQDFYRYDLTEKTIQRYFQDPAGENAASKEDYVKLAEDYNSLLSDFQLRLWIMIGLGVLAAVLAIVLIVVLTKKGKGGGQDGGSSRYDDRPEKPRSASGSSRGRKASKEERYMMGEEEEYEEPETDSDPDAYLPEIDVHTVRRREVAAPEQVSEQRTAPAPQAEDMEKAITAKLAREAAAAARQPKEEEFLDSDQDDFEFFDLDDK